VGDAWGNDNYYMVTKPVTLKAMIRVCADLATQDAEPQDGRIERWRERRALTDRGAFRGDGFYERFPPGARSSGLPASIANWRALRVCSRAEANAKPRRARAKNERTHSHRAHRRLQS
jgi:hypothetical protein